VGCVAGSVEPWQQRTAHPRSCQRLLKNPLLPAACCLETASPPPRRGPMGLGGADRVRTDDLRLARAALSQLSYSPSIQPAGANTRERDVLMRARVPRAVIVVGLGRFELPTSRLSGVRSNQLSYRPVGRSSRAPDRPRRSSDQVTAGGASDAGHTGRPAPSTSGKHAGSLETE
jgi:hypothetical protein